MDNFCYGPCDWKDYLFHWTDRFLEIDIALLALLLSYVLVIGTRGFVLTYFGRYQSRRFLAEAHNKLRSGAFEDVISIAKRHRCSPISKIAMSALSVSVSLPRYLSSAEIAEIVSNAVHRTRARIIRTASFGMDFLRAAGYSAPLLGLLGTCFGLFDSFRGAGMEKHALLAMTTSLVAYALIPTAAGLAVAVPAIAVYNHLQTSIDNLNSEMLAFGLNAVSLVVSEGRAVSTNKAEVEPDGNTTRLTPKFPLQKPLSQLLAPALTGALSVVTAAWTALANPYTPKGFDIRLLKPGEVLVRPSLTIEVMEESEAGSRIAFLNAKRTRLDELVASSVAPQQQREFAYISAEKNVPWADVATAIGAAKSLGCQVFLLPTSAELPSAKRRRSTNSRE